MKYTNQKKLTKIGVVLLPTILIGLGLLIYFNFNQDRLSDKERQSECIRLIEDSGKSLSQTKLKEVKATYGKLKPKSKLCGTVSDDKKTQEAIKSGEYVLHLQFDAQLAQLAFVTGDKDNARIVTDTAIKLNKQLTQTQRDKIPIAVFFDIGLINQGQYSSNMEYK